MINGMTGPDVPDGEYKVRVVFRCLYCLQWGVFQVDMALSNGKITSQEPEEAVTWRRIHLSPTLMGMEFYA